MSVMNIIDSIEDLNNRELAKGIVTDLKEEGIEDGIILQTIDAMIDEFDSLELILKDSKISDIKKLEKLHQSRTALENITERAFKTKTTEEGSC